MASNMKKYVNGEFWRERQLRLISNFAFDRVVNESSNKEELSFQDLYIATLLVFNDINRFWPGPHIDPPPREQLKKLIEEHDKNHNGTIGRDEFWGFIVHLTSDTFVAVKDRLILTLVIAPTVAMVTKKSTEGIPVVGKVVQQLPYSVYAFLVTSAAVVFQSARQRW